MAYKMIYSFQVNKLFVCFCLLSRRDFAEWMIINVAFLSTFCCIIVVHVVMMRKYVGGQKVTLGHAFLKIEPSLGTLL